MPRFTPVDWQTLERFFVTAGFRFARHEGSHRSYVREGVSRPVVIPTYAEAPVRTGATGSRSVWSATDLSALGDCGAS